MTHIFWRTTHRENELMEMEVSNEAFYDKIKYAQDTFKKYVIQDPEITERSMIASFDISPDRYSIPNAQETNPHIETFILKSQIKLSDEIQNNYGNASKVTNNTLLVRVTGPIPTLVKEDIPKSYKQMRETYYDFQVEELISLAEDLEHIHKDIQIWKDNLSKILSSDDFWEELAREDNDEYDINKYHIDNDIDAAIAGYKINTDELLARIASNAEKDINLRKVTSSLSIIDNSITYGDFPLNVRSFMTKRFAGVLSDELNRKLEKTTIAFMERPTGYSPDIAGELLDGNIIAYYLPKESISNNWYGIVHELTHIVQSHLKGKVDGIPNKPNIKAEGYISGTEAYYQDPGEMHAYATANEYLTYDETRGGEPLIDNEFDDIKSQNFDMFSKRFELYGDSGPNIFWSGKDAQNTRFDAILSISDFNGKTVLDIGCGFGDFAKYCKTKGIKLAGYKGVDIVEGIIDVAKKQNPEYDFETRDIMDDPVGKDVADIVIASGIFALSHRNYNDYVIKMMSVMQYHAKEFTVANFLKQNPEATDTGLKYHEPEDMLQLIQYRVSSDAQLADDYIYDDFTIFIEETPNE